MLLVILAIWFGYKKGRDSGRSGPLWAIICGVAFIGVQLLVAVAIGAFIGLGIAMFGWRESLYEQNQIFVSIAAWIASVIALLLIFRYLDRIPDEPVVTQPPPPPTFAPPE